MVRETIMKQLQANTQTREVIGQTGWSGPAKLHHVENKYAVIKVPGGTYWSHGFHDYEPAVTIVCRVTSRKKDTVWLEELFMFHHGP